jgi:hypothetical protein
MIPPNPRPYQLLRKLKASYTSGGSGGARGADFAPPQAYYVLWVTDTHGGHRAGLLNPETEFDYVDIDGVSVRRKPELNYFQELLWGLFEDKIDEANTIIGDDQVVVVHGGDLCHGNKHPEGILTTQYHNQVIIGAYIIDHLFQRFKNNMLGFRFALGTSAHNWGEGALELIVMQLLQERYPDVDIKTTMHAYFRLGGVWVDCAHHGPGPGIRTWTSGNQIRYYTKSLGFQELSRGRPIPGLVMRGHFHDACREVVNFKVDGDFIETHSFIAPGLCGMTFYANRATKSHNRNDYGVVLAKVQEGKVVWSKVLFETLDVRTREVFS